MPQIHRMNLPHSAYAHQRFQGSLTSQKRSFWSDNPFKSPTLWHGAALKESFVIRNVDCACLNFNMAAELSNGSFFKKLNKTKNYKTGNSSKTCLAGKGLGLFKNKNESIFFSFLYQPARQWCSLPRWNRGAMWTCPGNVNKTGTSEFRYCISLWPGPPWFRWR